MTSPNDEAIAALKTEIERLGTTIDELRAEMRWATGMVAAAHLVAVDAARSREVFATLMDENLVETAERLVRLMGDRMTR